MAKFGFVGLINSVVSYHRSEVNWRLIGQSHWPEVIVICTVTAAWLLMRNMSVSHDVIWQMWVARQILGGAKLYTDILELNPPLWFWLAVPIQKAAQLLDVAPKQAIIAAMFGYILMTQLTIATLIAEFDPLRRAVLLAVAAAACIVVPLTDFAQREHLALVAAIPYSMLTARRAEGRKIHWGLAITVGVLAATGFALKHYFVAVPVLLEAWLLLKHGRNWKPIRPETLVLLGAALLYAAAICIIAPEYITTIVPMLNLAYFGYEIPFIWQLLKPFSIFWFFAAVTLFVLRRFSDTLSAATAIAGVGFVLSYFLQQKGFNYHAVSATGMLFVSIGSLLQRRCLEGVPINIVAGTMLMPILISIIFGPYSNPFEKRVSHLLEQAERGKPVMMLAANPSTIWPMVEERGYIWPSRHFAMWMLTAFGKQLRNEGQLSPAMQELAREMRAQTVVDLTCNPPDLIIVDDLRMSKAQGINAVAFFSIDQDFRALFAHYKKARIWGNFTSYFRDANWQPVRSASCRTIH